MLKWDKLCLKKVSHTHTQFSRATTHELKHALADQGTGEISLQKQGKLTIPTYSALGTRTAEEKTEIATAPEDTSPHDFKIAEESKPKKKLFGLF